VSCLRNSARVASFLGIVSLARVTLGETPGRAPSVPPEEPSATAVVIVLVGPAGESSELVALVSELLGRRELETSVTREPEFQPHELLAQRESDRSVWVYVALGGGQSARLYFRGPGGQRFLLRELGLPSGLDAVGREGIAQVIDSSVHSLLFSSAGLSRDQARHAIEQAQREAAPKPAPSAAPPSAAPPPTPPAAPSVPSAPPNVVGLVGLRYAAEYTGQNIGAAHGPGVELGIGTRRPTKVGVRLAADRFFPQDIESKNVEAGIQTTRLVLRGYLEWPLGAESAVVVGLGGGTDITRIEPRAAAQSVTLEPKSTDLVPVVSTEARLELRPGAWSLGVGLLANVALADTHYDLHRPGGTARVAGVWPIRPGAVLGFGWAP
jgi:hypothetical protein